MMIMTGIYPLQQGLCMFYLKSSKDPLEGISKLDALCLVSSTQVQTPVFIDKIVSSEQYKMLELD